MAAERIDVRALIKKAADVLDEDCFQMAAVEAAVAELIEKSAALATAVAEETEYFATHKHLDEASFFENRVVQCTDELRAALARVQGEGA